MNWSITNEQTETLTRTKVATKEAPQFELTLFNDDVNTFDWVIESLVEVCEHEVNQAEQCALIVHNRGKCAVKTGSFEELKPMCTSLLDRGLSAEIL
jgi:ATP-dependent Clp protease adaptor protein ClpS